MTRPNLILAVLCLALIALPAAAQDTNKPCSEPESSHFDFWVGEWVVFSNGQEVGFNKISRIQGGCTMLEVSNDEGQTWQLLFDGIYRHR